MDKTIIYVIRHAQSYHNIGNYEEKFNAKVDITEEGVRQAKKLAEDFVNIHLDKIYSSDYLRAYKTAKFLADVKKMEVIQDPQIRERDFGETYMSNVEEVRAKIKTDFARLSDEQKFNYKYSPDMESAKDGAIRLNDFLLKISEVDKGKVVVVVCHGNIMRSFLNLIHWAKFDEITEGAIENTGFIKLEIENEKFKVLETSKVYIGSKGNRIM